MKNRSKQIFREHGGQLRMSEAIKNGISRYMLYKLRDKGVNDAFNAGVENHRIDEVPVKIYNMEKTLADCFKFRNKVGMDVVLEALKLYKARRNFNLNKLIKYAKICRVKNVMLPYLETII